MNSQIFVKTIEGKIISIILPKGFKTTILEVKEQAKKTIGINPEEIELIYGGQQFQNSYTLDELEIQNESTLQMIRRTYGGEGFSFQFQNIKKAREEEFCKEGHDFRVVNPGLNFLVYCDSCKEIVVIQIGFNKNEKEYFDIGSIRNHMKCPIYQCKSKINPKGLKNIELLKSVWKYEYQLIDEDKAQSGLCFNPDNSKYITFDESNENKLDYEYLFLRVIKKEAEIVNVKNSSFSSPYSKFNKKLKMLFGFNFHGDETIIISNHR